MSTFLSKVFSALTPGNVEVLAELTQIHFKSYFYTVGITGQQQELLLAVTRNYLIVSQNLKGQQINQYCPINFELKFQVLRKQWPDQKTPGLPYGVRLERGPHNDAVQIYNNNLGIIQQWIAVLSKKINQRNFHKLFKAKKKIGKGAFATVYLAQRLVDKKMVAVKAFSKEKQFSGDKGKQSLQNQIKIMRSIDHPNITTLEQVYETDNSIYVILEYLEGKQLNEQIKNGRKFTPEQTMIIIRQILMGLDHLAKKRIIHRDLKPQNIMFKRENSLELGICDFGLATYADQSKYLFVRCGTPGFVAPQIINIKDMSTKSQPISDVFSAGIIFHILSLGHSVFPGKKYNDVLAQNRSCDFNFSSQQYAALSQSSLSLLILMLQKDPKKRISAERALSQDYFQQSSYKFNSHSMDIEQKTVYKNRYPLLQINFNNNSINQRNSSVNYEQKMIDENQKKLSQSIGQSVKKKLSFMNNPNPHRISERRE